MKRWRIVGTVAVGLVVAWLTPWPVTGESLAEVAAREKTRREHSEKAAETKVITQDDLEGAHADARDAPHAAEQAPIPEPEKTGADDDSSDGGRRADESSAQQEKSQRRIRTAEIRGRYKAAEERVERARTELEAARAARAELPGTLPVYTGLTYGSIRRADERIERAEDALSRAQDRLDEIADEARRAGVYPGDLRD